MRGLRFKIANLVLGGRSEFKGFAGKDCELLWSTGVLECWKKQKPEFQFALLLSFHYSITPADYRKGERLLQSPPLHTIVKPWLDDGVRGQPKAGSFGSGFFISKRIP